MRCTSECFLELRSNFSLWADRSLGEVVNLVSVSVFQKKTKRPSLCTGELLQTAIMSGKGSSTTGIAVSNDLVLKIIFAAASGSLTLKENILLENPGFYESPLPVLRMCWLTSVEKKNIFGSCSLFPRLTAHCDSGNRWL